jgi:hypothetical protein
MSSDERREAAIERVARVLNPRAFSGAMRTSGCGDPWHEEGHSSHSRCPRCGSKEHDTREGLVERERRAQEKALALAAVAYQAALGGEAERVVARLKDYRLFGLRCDELSRDLGVHYRTKHDFIAVADIPAALSEHPDQPELAPEPTIQRSGERVGSEHRERTSDREFAEALAVPIAALEQGQLRLVAERLQRLLRAALLRTPGATRDPEETA